VVVKLDRRTFLAGLTLTALPSSGLVVAQERSMLPPTDFEFLCHDWRVHHRKLATRLAGANDWYEFEGSSSTRSIMAGFGNVEDNWLQDPHGPYRAAALRGFDATHQVWRIWWLDLRFPTAIGVPTTGAFDGDRGEFFADESWQGTPVKLRFVWHKNGGSGPRWEQAFSVDGGRDWETNWTMDFTRR
jgi:hypothetical protein